MKKLFLASNVIIFIYVIVACSSDKTVTSSDVNESSLNQNLPHSNVRVSKTTLDSLYKIMIVSASYLDYIAAERAFVDKMNFDGSSSDLENQTTILAWISTNLAKTSFTSYSTAVSKMSDVRDKLATLNTDQSHFLMHYQMLMTMTLQM